MPDHKLAATAKPDLLDRFLAPAEVCVVGAVVGASLLLASVVVGLAAWGAFFFFFKQKTAYEMST